MGRVGSYLGKIKQVLVPGKEPLGMPRVQIGNVKHPVFIFSLPKVQLSGEQKLSDGNSLNFNRTHRICTHHLFLPL